jgi:hypothetical protein
VVAISYRHSRGAVLVTSYTLLHLPRNILERLPRDLPPHHDALRHASSLSIRDSLVRIPPHNPHPPPQNPTSVASISSSAGRSTFTKKLSDAHGDTHPGDLNDGITDDIRDNLVDIISSAVQYQLVTDGGPVDEIYCR